MNNGWKVYRKKSGGNSGGALEKYKDRLVVYIGGGASRYMYFSNALFEALGKPVRVTLLTRGSNIGIVKDEEGFGFKVQHQVERTPTRFVSATKLAEEFNLKPGVYDVHMESGNIGVFDTTYPPSIPA